MSLEPRRERRRIDHHGRDPDRRDDHRRRLGPAQQDGRRNRLLLGLARPGPPDNPPQRRRFGPGVEFTRYNLREADPEGVEPFRICAELVGDSETTASEESKHRDCSLVRTSECYGDIHVTVREEGSLAVIYVVC